nr:MAG TPA: hypothetical protein [Caudoviricetes sp.]
MCTLFAELTCYFGRKERICHYRKGKQRKRRTRP